MALTAGSEAAKKNEKILALQKAAQAHADTTCGAMPRDAQYTEAWNRVRREFLSESAEARSLGLLGSK